MGKRRNSMDDYIWQPGEKKLAGIEETPSFWVENWKFVITTVIAVGGLLVACLKF